MKPPSAELSAGQQDEQAVDVAAAAEGEAVVAADQWRRKKRLS